MYTNSHSDPLKPKTCNLNMLNLPLDLKMVFEPLSALVLCSPVDSSPPDPSVHDL